MYELLIVGSKKGVSGLSVDFENLDIGSQTFEDKNGHPFSLVGTLGTSGGVVDDPVMGKCFYFPGTGYFETPMVTDLQLNGKAAVLECVFKWDGAGQPASSVWETGNYPSGQPGTPGLSLSVGQYPATYIQYFILNPQANNWVRALPPNVTNISAWETVRYDRSVDGSGPMTVYRDGSLFSSVSVPSSPVGNGSKLSVGGSYTYGGKWRGWLKSLKITFK